MSFVTASPPCGHSLGALNAYIKYTGTRTFHKPVTSDQPFESPNRAAKAAAGRSPPRAGGGRNPGARSRRQSLHGVFPACVRIARCERRSPLHSPHCAHRDVMRAMLRSTGPGPATPLIPSARIAGMQACSIPPVAPGVAGCCRDGKAGPQPLG